MTDHENPNSSFDPLNAPVDAVPAHPPVITRIQVLPFGELTWENFERLCYRLAGRTERVEYVARYGRSGQAQQGIDLFARIASGKWRDAAHEDAAARLCQANVAGRLARRRHAPRCRRRGRQWKERCPRDLRFSGHRQSCGRRPAATRREGCAALQGQAAFQPDRE